MASSLAQHRAIRTWNRAKTVTDKDGNPSISTVNQGTETLTTSRALMAPTGTAVKVVTRSPTTTIHTVTFPTPRTVTIILAVYLEESFVTLRGAQGTPTATRTTHVPLNKIPWTTMSEARSAFVTFCPAVTVTDSNGVPVATLKAPGSEPRHFDLNAPLRNASSIPRFDPISSREYILAAFTPTIVTLPLTILAQILSSSLKATWPFHALTQPPPGATASDSVALTTGGFSGVLTWLRLALHRGDFLLLLADALNLLCAGAVAFSTEAFGIRLLGSCTASDFSGCHMGIAIFRAPGRLVQVFLSLGLAILAVLATLLWNWNSGMTGAEGRRIASIAALLTDPETRKIFRHNKPNDKLHGSLKNKEIVESLAGYSSSIQKSASVITSAEGCYIAVYKLSEESPKTTTKKPSSQFKFKFNSKFSLPKMAFPRLRLSGETVGRILYFLSLIAFLILIVYYELTSHEGTPFEDFMNSQNLGVRALFAGLGVAASLFWDHCFSSMSFFFFFFFFFPFSTYSFLNKTR
ncbi:hypothetical protein QBC44DRAFT_251199 [Cladorrhinum sp. PSN332]|nr:hypothetical protein QBC44DRAFT_251199 [Cladorrhinum sp. PSN332]